MKVSSEQAAVSSHQKKAFLLFFALFTAHCSLHAYAQSSLAEQAQAAWAMRDQPGQTEAAIHFWTQAAQAEPGQAALWIDLAKAQGRAVRHATSSKERKKWADAARASAERAVQLDPHSAAAYTVYGEALGQWADANKGIHSLGAVRDAINALQKAIAIDPTHAYAHMLLSEFYRQSPRHISVGDKAKALEQARLAVQYGPTYAINHLAFARAYLDLGKKEEAINELQTILTLPAPADAIPETRADQETARTMLASLGAAPIPAPCGEPGAGTCTEQRP